METVILQREPFEQGHTYGAIWCEDVKVCDTIELPWEGNQPRISCIPEGEYTAIPHNSANHPNTWEIAGVPDRMAILIHNGNVPEEDSLGCILVGKTGILDGQAAVLDSVNTLNSLRKILPSTFNLKIINATST